MSPRLASPLVAIAAASVTLTLSIPAADAASNATKTVSSKVKIKGFDGSKMSAVEFYGNVKSKKGACEKGRKVKLRQIDQDLLAGKDKTNRKGKWKIVFDGDKIEPGKFKAIVVKKTIKVNGKRIVCAGDTFKYDVNAPS